MSADSTSSAITKKSTWKPPPLPLKATDSLLIGFAGVALTVANPAFWSGSLFSVTDVQLLPPFFYLLGLLMNVYSIVIPGAVMWPLTVRRTNSHDFYDLFKPSLACFACLLIPLAVVLALKTDYTVLVMSTTLPNDVSMGVP